MCDKAIPSFCFRVCGQDDDDDDDDAGAEDLNSKAPYFPEAFEQNS